MGAIFLATYARFVISREGNAAAWQQVAPDHYGLGFTLSNLGNSLILHFGQLCVMASLAVLLSLIVSQITAIIFCFLAYFGGQMSSYWQNLGSDTRTLNESAPGLSRGIQGLVKVVHFALPRLDRFDVREKIINDIPVGFGYVWKSWNSGLIYCAVLIVVAMLIFSDREF